MNDFFLVGNIISLVFGALGIVIVVGIAIRLVRDRYSRERREYGEVVNKQMFETEMIGKDRMPFKKRKCIISFMCGGRRLDFETPEFMYGEYSIGDKGTVVYKGSRLIEFIQQ